MARRPPSEPTPSVARGAALVVVAVLAGLFLLSNGVDTSVTLTTPREPGQAPETGGDVAADEGDDPETTTTSEIAARPPAQVVTIVLNGSGVTGAAGVYSTALADNGYQMLDPGNAAGRVEATQVLFATGFDQEAQVVANTIGAPASVVPQPLSDPPPGEVGDANVVVVIGPDLGSVAPPPPGGGSAPVEGGTGEAPAEGAEDGT